MKKIANVLSGILFFAAFLPYVWAILHRETVPSPVTWAIWAAIDTFAFLAMKKAEKVRRSHPEGKGEKISFGQLIGAILGAYLVTMLAVFYGKSTIGIAEIITVVIAAIVVLVWKTTGNHNLGIIFSQIALLAGAIPTFVDAWRNPRIEDPVAWLIWLSACIFGLIAVKKWTIEDAAQPVAFTTIETVMVFLVVIRPHAF